MKSTFMSFGNQASVTCGFARSYTISTEQHGMNLATMLTNRLASQGLARDYRYGGV